MIPDWIFDAIRSVADTIDLSDATLVIDEPTLGDSTALVFAADTFFIQKA